MEISSAGNHEQSTNTQARAKPKASFSPESEQQPDKAHVCCNPKEGSADGKNLVSTFLARPFLPAASHSSGVPGEISHPAASAPGASGTLTSEVLHQHSPTKGPSLMLTASGPGWSRALSWICQLLVVHGFSWSLYYLTSEGCSKLGSLSMVALRSACLFLTKGMKAGQSVE